MVSQLDQAGTARPTFDTSRLERIRSSLERQGVTFWTGDDAVDFLRVRNAEAAYLPDVGRPGIIVLRPSPSRVAVIEELLHLGQHRRLAWGPIDENDTIRLEVEAQEALLRLRAAKGWLAGELQQIASALNWWRSRQ